MFARQSMDMHPILCVCLRHGQMPFFSFHCRAFLLFCPQPKVVHHYCCNKNRNLYYFIESPYLFFPLSCFLTFLSATQSSSPSLAVIRIGICIILLSRQVRRTCKFFFIQESARIDQAVDNHRAPSRIRHTLSLF